MNHDIPLKYFDIADEYATECAEPVAEAEAGINPVRIDEIAEFLNQWGNE